MPFISDDFEWKLVGDKEPFDRERFVPVRKLHVASYIDFVLEELSVEQIYQHIEKFGDIESIELSPNKKSAHVTFVSDRSAYLMQLQHDFDEKMCNEKPYSVYPADSWKQPPENSDSPPEQGLENPVQTAEIFMLNEDCLLHLFKYLDLDSLVNMADVCKVFNGLLNKHCFPRIRQFEFKNENKTFGYDPLLFSTSLVKMRRTLRCIGHHITDLIFQSDAAYGPEKESIFNHAIIRRFLAVLVENVGTNIRRAWISGGRIFYEDHAISIIAPVLRHLEVLKIKAPSNEDFTWVDIDFPTMCPNLIDFGIGGPFSLNNCTKPWSRLQSLAFKEDVRFVEGSDGLQSYFERNPQLTYVKFSTKEPQIDISAAVADLPMVEKFGVGIPSHENPFIHIQGEHIACLKSLQHLTEVTILNLEHSNLNGIIGSLATCVELRKIHLEIKFDDHYDYDEAGEKSREQSLIKLARQLPKLEIFELHGGTITKGNLMKFVRFASRLKTLTLCNSGLTFYDKIILELANVLECNRPQPSDALVLELDSSSFFVYAMNVNERELVLPYLQIKSKD